MKILNKGVSIFALLLMPADAVAQRAISPDEVGVTPGVPLTTGLGHFADPGNYHGLVLGIQAGLGASGNSDTFGYDDFSVSLRWIPGTNAIGKRISVLGGFSDWYTPAFRRVFPDSVIDPLADQERFAAASSNAASIGISFTFGDRVLGREVSVPISKAVHDELQAIDTEYDQSGTSGPRRRELDEQRRAILTREARRTVMRAPSLTAGLLTRLTSFAEEADVEAFDAFAAAGYGRGLWDSSVAIHYLRYLDNQFADDAWTAAAGVFLELSDGFPAPILGIATSYGRYRYQELHHVIPDAAEAIREPLTDRYDVVVSLSGAPARSDQPAAGFGVRYSRLNRSLLESRNVFSLVFSSNFKLLPQ